MRKLFLLFSIILLSSCTSLQERCENEGYSPGTAGFYACVDSRRQAALITAMIMSESASRAFPVPQPAQTVTPYRTMTCRQVGSYVQCSGGY